MWAGVGARMWPQLLREHAEVQRIKAEDQEAEQFWAKGLGPTDIGDELAQVALPLRFYFCVQHAILSLLPRHFMRRAICATHVFADPCYITKRCFFCLQEPSSMSGIVPWEVCVVLPIMVKLIKVILRISKPPWCHMCFIRGVPHAIPLCATRISMKLIFQPTWLASGNALVSCTNQLSAMLRQHVAIEAL